MSRLLKTSGFTLIELMVSVAIFSVVTLAAFAVLSSGQQLSVTMDQTVQVQQNVRMALDLMARDIRMTGYGNPPANVLAGCANHLNASVQSALIPLGNIAYVPGDNAVGADNGSDSISIMTMDQQIGTLGAAYITGDTITLCATCALPSDIAIGDVVSIDGVFTGSVSGFNVGAKTISMNQPGTGIAMSIIPPVQFLPGAPVVRLACVTYAVTDGLGQIGGAPVLNPPMPFQLIRMVNGLNPMAMVDGIESLQLAYGVDTDADGIINDQAGGLGGVVDCLDFVPNNTACSQGGVPLAAGTANDLRLIPNLNATPTSARLVRITVVGRAVPPAAVNVVGSTWSDPTYTGNSAIQAEDQLIPATPGIRRRALSRVVNLRDASIL